MNDKCIEPGCNASVKNGNTIYRTSLKGEKFEGKCKEHHPGPLDPEVVLISEIIEKGN